jgi:membrane protein
VAEINEEKKGIVQLFKKTGAQFSDDDCMSMAAGLAYYTIFALPPLLVILIAIGSAVFEREQVEQALEAQMQGVMDSNQIDEIVSRTQDTGAGITASIIGVVLLLFGATGVVAQLQTSLNRVWEVEPDPELGGIRNFITKRVLSLGMILAVAFLLLVSLVLSSILSAMGSYITDMLPGDFWEPILWIINILVSLIVFSLLFAAMFKILPDAEITWRDVAVGSTATAVLFLVGQFLLGLYLGNAEVAGPYGAAGSLVLVLVWVYYSSLILLLGAEFTQVWARRYGKQIEPSEGAVRAIQRTHREREPDAPSPKD